MFVDHKKICDRCHKKNKEFVHIGGKNDDATKTQFFKYYICRDCADEFVIEREKFEKNFVESYKYAIASVELPLVPPRLQEQYKERELRKNIKCYDCSLVILHKCWNCTSPCQEEKFSIKKCEKHT